MHQSKQKNLVLNTYLINSGPIIEEVCNYRQIFSHIYYLLQEPGAYLCIDNETYLEHAYPRVI